MHKSARLFLLLKIGKLAETVKFVKIHNLARSIQLVTMVK